MYDGRGGMELYLHWILNFALGGVSDELYSLAALTAVKESQVPVEWEGGWAPRLF
jgi:hypothetical protein